MALYLGAELRWEGQICNQLDSVYQEISRFKICSNIFYRQLHTIAQLVGYYRIIKYGDLSATAVQSNYHIRYSFFLASVPALQSHHPEVCWWNNKILISVQVSENNKYLSTDFNYVQKNVSPSTDRITDITEFKSVQISANNRVHEPNDPCLRRYAICNLNGWEHRLIRHTNLSGLNDSSMFC